MKLHYEVIIITTNHTQLEVNHELTWTFPEGHMANLIDWYSLFSRQINMGYNNSQE